MALNELYVIVFHNNLQNPIISSAKLRMTSEWTFKGKTKIKSKFQRGKLFYKKKKKILLFEAEKRAGGVNFMG